MPKLDTLAQYQPAQVSRIYNTDGELIAEYADEHRILVPLHKIPDQLKNAFLAAEDAYFYQHPGINPARILAAAIANLRAGHTVQGGSTITQQVAKNFLLTSERTYTRKIREIILSYRIEQAFSKDEILFLYLNHIYLGRGAYGVASAAWRYFGKSLDELTLGECAVLAGLPKAPGKYAPHLNPEQAIQRRNTVLNMMVENGFAEPESIQEALVEPLVVAPLQHNKLVNAYANTVYQQLTEAYGDATIRKQGLTVILPYQPRYEEAAIRALQKNVLEVEQRQFYRPPAQHPADTWPELLEKWADRLTERHSEKPFKPAESEIFPALIEKVNRNGSLIANDGIQRWDIPKPDWHWDSQSDKPASERRYKWKAGDEILLQGTGDGGVRLTQKPSVEAALYSVDLEKGTLLASVGGFDYTLGDFDRVSQALRQPGSSFKPFLYATAMEQGMTPASIVMDSPLVFDSKEGDNFWRPENYMNQFAGPVTLRDALEHSRNMAAIKLLQDIGIHTFQASLSRYPFNREFPSQLSIALGTTEVTLKELAESYIVLASQGKKWTPVSIQQVQDRTGKTLHRSVAGHRCQVCHADPVLATGPAMQPSEQVLDPTSTFLTVNMMKGVVERGTGWRAKALGRPSAGKTGTTNQQVDAWYMGFTPQVLTGVWVGRDTPESMGHSETGSKAALPIWVDAMQAFEKDRPVVDFTPTDDIEWVAIDRKTGKLASAETENPLLESFRIGTAPTEESATSENTENTSEEDFFSIQ